jgi:hypothetical protein
MAAVSVFSQPPSQDFKSNPFSAPAHPAETYLTNSRRTAALNPISTRDPHDRPTFEGDALREPTSPIMYLPPLLSSLPRDLPRHDEVDRPPLANPPLSTETHLPDIDPVSLSLHKALHHFHPVTTEYAMVPYADAFNWHELELPLEEEREWYVVAFRSRRRAGSDGGRKYNSLVGSNNLLIYYSFYQRYMRQIKKLMKKLSKTAG